MGSISGSFITIFCVRGELRFHLTFKYSTLVLPRCVLLATFWWGGGVFALVGVLLVWTARMLHGRARL